MNHRRVVPLGMAVAATVRKADAMPASSPSGFPFSELASDSPGTAADACLCGHLDTEHDAVATRYCAATEVGALPRSCMCPVQPVAAARSYDRR
jgi:hypothetical protein